MSSEMRFSVVTGGNYLFKVHMDEERNKNKFLIHDQSMGETLFKSSEIWDTDLFKIVRILKKYEYDHRNKIDAILKDINRNCRHLEISVIKYGAEFFLLDTSNL